MSYITLPYTKLSIPCKDGGYAKTIYRPLLDTKLFFKSSETLFSFPSIVDSGADFCIFPAKFGSIIGINIRKGRSVITNGIGGQETLYFHKVKVGVEMRNEMWKFNADVGFSYKMNKKGVSLLGRKGFFDQFAEIAFNQKKRMFKIKE